jgi:hypothetical protein
VVSNKERVMNILLYLLKIWPIFVITLAGLMMPYIVKKFPQDAYVVSSPAHTKNLEVTLT